MKVFISWSGERSRKVAELLRTWVACVLQNTKPWVSSKDIDRGTIWFTKIADEIRDTTVGIICLTAENKDRPWILFETGALAKGLESSRVCPILIDLKTEDLVDPLAQFNLTTPNYDGIFSLISTLNAALEDSALGAAVLKQSFDAFWPTFESGYAAIIQETETAPQIPQRSSQEILSEILTNTRFISSRVAAIDGQNSLGGEPPLSMRIKAGRRISTDTDHHGPKIPGEWISFSMSGRPFSYFRREGDSRSLVEIQEEIRRSIEDSPDL